MLIIAALSGKIVEYVFFKCLYLLIFPHFMFSTEPWTVVMNQHSQSHYSNQIISIKCLIVRASSISIFKGDYPSQQHDRNCALKKNTLDMFQKKVFSALIMSQQASWGDISRRFKWSAQGVFSRGILSSSRANVKLRTTLGRGQKAKASKLIRLTTLVYNPLFFFCHCLLKY